MASGRPDLGEDTQTLSVADLHSLQENAIEALASARGWNDTTVAVVSGYMNVPSRANLEPFSSEWLRLIERLVASLEAVEQEDLWGVIAMWLERLMLFGGSSPWANSNNKAGRELLREMWFGEPSLSANDVRDAGYLGELSLSLAQVQLIESTARENISWFADVGVRERLNRLLGEFVETEEEPTLGRLEATSRWFQGTRNRPCAFAMLLGLLNLPFGVELSTGTVRPAADQEG